MGTVPIGIRIGACIGIGVGSVETVLHITFEANSIGIGIGIGVGQWKHTITHITVLILIIISRAKTSERY